MKRYSLLKGCFFAIFIFCVSLGFSQKATQQKVKILDFRVEKKDNKVNIHWSTDKNSETNYFEVEKSSDGKNFNTVALVMGPDPTVKNCECYGCFDKITAKTSESYYRLKHVNTDGEVEFSEVKMIALK